MVTDEQTGNVLEYLYLHQETPVTLDEVVDASDLARDTVQAAVDDLEERMMVQVGTGADDTAGLTLTQKGIDTVEVEGDFSDAFGTPLDLNRIAREWD